MDFGLTLPTAFCRLSTARTGAGGWGVGSGAGTILDFGLTVPTANCLLFFPSAQPLVFCLLPTAYCLLPTAYCLLPTAYCLLFSPSPCFLEPSRLPAAPNQARRGVNRYWGCGPAGYLVAMLELKLNQLPPSQFVLCRIRLQVHWIGGSDIHDVAYGKQVAKAVIQIIPQALVVVEESRCRHSPKSVEI